MEMFERGTTAMYILDISSHNAGEIVKILSGFYSYVQVTPIKYGDRYEHCQYKSEVKSEEDKKNK